MSFAPRRRASLTLACALALALSACGSSDGADPAPNDPLTTDPAVTAPAATEPTDTEPGTTDSGDTEDPLDVEFSSEPIEVGPLFGDATASSAADDAAEEVVTDAPEPSSGEPPAGTAPAFVPADEDGPFCTLLDDLNGRPFPSDDFEALVVANVWIGELRKLAVPEITGDLDALLEFLDVAIAANGDIDVTDSSDAIDDAADRVGDYVNERCLGMSDVAATTEE